MKSRIPKNIPQETKSYAPNVPRAIASPMTDAEFWAKLDRLTVGEQTFEKTQEFIQLLRKGYNENRKILVYGVTAQDDPDAFHQSQIMGSLGKSMLYLTDRKHENYTKLLRPAISDAKIECIEAPLRSVLNNALSKETVSALIFNYGTEQEFVVLKLMLEAAMEIDSIIE